MARGLKAALQHLFFYIFAFRIRTTDSVFFLYYENAAGSGPWTASFPVLKEAVEIRTMDSVFHPILAECDRIRTMDRVLARGSVELII